MTNLEKFMFYLRDLESPDHFIRWNWYFLVASCLERRIWFGSDYKIYPNLYMIFVAKPGFGKTLPAKQGEALLRSLVTIKDNQESQIIKTSPETISFEKLVTILSRPSSVETIAYDHNPTRHYTHTSVSFCLGDEIGTLLRDHSPDVITFLCKGWDCGDHKSDTVKHGEQVISNMCINLLGCCTPNWIGRQLDSSLLNEGLLGRLIFIYGDKPRKRTTILQTNDEQRIALNELRKHLVLLTRIKPRQNGIIFSPEETPEAFEWYDNWVQTKMDIRVNDSPYMDHYYSRKKACLVKLAMARHFSEQLTMTLTVEDFIGALEELELNEATMHCALSGSAKNPVYTISENIKKYLLTHPNATAKRIMVDHFADAPKGEEDIVKAIQYLTNTNQIIQFTNSKNLQCYKLNLNKKIENEIKYTEEIESNAVSI